jgi:hypothetical protein
VEIVEDNMKITHRTTTLMLSSGVDGCVLPEFVDMSSKLSELPLQRKRKLNKRITIIFSRPL